MGVLARIVLGGTTIGVVSSLQGPEATAWLRRLQALVVDGLRVAAQVLQELSVTLSKM